MIGVALDATDLAIAQEFFELFKTPWEVAVPGRRYSIALSTIDEYEGFDAPVVLAYGSAQRRLDHQMHASMECGHSGDVTWGNQKTPIYGRVARFGRESGGLTLQGKPIEYEARLGTRVVRRIGYDLFQEVRHLLTKGQPVSRASIPTLELHIDVLRRLLLASGVAFVEIPARPAGFEFSCCLTHDVDFFGIRRHTFDRTLAGFVARASVGAAADFVRGRRPLAEVIRNWRALCSLPAVFSGAASDFWCPFDDYARADAGLPSTFFLVPFKGQAGVSPEGVVRTARAVPYEIGDIGDEARDAAARGSELAVHGIDAWRDADAGRAERAQLTSVTGQARAGVRMHWLYFDQDSPHRLDAAGFDYDSTYGYNDAVGYRAGTSQVFQIPGTRLMELPLSIMDSAMFFSDRMALTREGARERWQLIVQNARSFGGTVVINWHDRSLAPERQWGRPYAELLEDVQEGDRAWFATASQLVDWFRWRRAMTFERDAHGSVTIVSPASHSTLPAAQVVVWRPGTPAVEKRTLQPDTTLRLGL